MVLEKENFGAHAECIRILLENNLDKNIKNNEGKTACDYAKLNTCKYMQ